MTRVRVASIPVGAKRRARRFLPSYRGGSVAVQIEARLLRPDRRRRCRTINFPTGEVVLVADTVGQAGLGRVRAQDRRISGEGAIRKPWRVQGVFQNPAATSDTKDGGRVGPSGDLAATSTERRKIEHHRFRAARRGIRRQAGTTAPVRAEVHRETSEKFFPAHSTRRVAFGNWPLPPPYCSRLFVNIGQDPRLGEKPGRNGAKTLAYRAYKGAGGHTGKSTGPA